MNEADVREDVAMPLLAALGYAAGTANDIARQYLSVIPGGNSFLASEWCEMGVESLQRFFIAMRV